MASAPFSFNALFTITAVAAGVSITLTPAGSGAVPNGLTTVVINTADAGNGKLVVGQGIILEVTL